MGRNDLLSGRRALTIQCNWTVSFTHNDFGLPGLISKCIHRYSVGEIAQPPFLGEGILYTEFDRKQQRLRNMVNRRRKWSAEESKMHSLSCCIVVDALILLCEFKMFPPFHTLLAAFHGQAMN
jgi:hypothetical protein